jgi:hypothetical protein
MPYVLLNSILKVTALCLGNATSSTIVIGIHGFSITISYSLSFRFELSQMPGYHVGVYFLSLGP